MIIATHPSRISSTNSDVSLLRCKAGRLNASDHTDVSTNTFTCAAAASCSRTSDPLFGVIADHEKRELMNTAKAWPFDDPDPRNLATITVGQVLSREKPILFVSHDVDDGGWQFLSGPDVDQKDAKLVCLEDVIALDDSLLELAELRLGWTARRSARHQPWILEPAVPTEWGELSATSYEYTEEGQKALQSEFAIQDFERYDCNQERATLTFSNGGIAGVRFRIQIVGSTSDASRTWLWSWANSTILEEAAGAVHHLQRFGAQHGLERLSVASWTSEEVDAWEATAIACFLLGGRGVYRAPYENGALFMVLSEPELLTSSAAQN